MKHLDNERGMVLLMVLAIVALLAALLSELAYSTLVDLRLTETFRDRTRAYYLAKGGVAAGRMILRQDQNAFDSKDELWAQGVESFPVDESFVTVRIEDLGGRLDINRLVQPGGENPDSDFKGRFIRLFGHLGMENPEELTAALIDWIDVNEDIHVDTDTQARGAENSYYQGLERPYPCKDAPFSSLEELALVRGFSDTVLRLVLPHVTVYGEAKINANTASPEVMAALAPDVELEAADRIVTGRQRKPFASTADLNNLPNFDEGIIDIKPYLGVTSNFYRITTQGLVGDGRRTVTAFVDKGKNKLLYWKVD